jgi:acyl carrier protein
MRAVHAAPDCDSDWGEPMATSTEKTVMQYMRAYLRTDTRRVSKRTSVRNLTWNSDDPLAFVKLSFDLEDAFGVSFDDAFWNQRKLHVSDVAEAIDRALGVRHLAFSTSEIPKSDLSQAG